MKGSNYDVLLLRPQDIADVIDMGKAIDLVEQGYREAQDFPLINAPRRRVHSRSNVRISSFPGGVDGLGVIGSLTRGERVAHNDGTQDYVTVGTSIAGGPPHSSVLAAFPHTAPTSGMRRQIAYRARDEGYALWGATCQSAASCWSR